MTRSLVQVSSTTPAAPAKADSGAAKPSVESSAKPVAAKVPAPAPAPVAVPAPAPSTSSKPEPVTAPPAAAGAKSPDASPEPTPAPGAEEEIEVTEGEALAARTFETKGIKGLIFLTEEKAEDLDTLTAALELLSDECSGSEDARCVAYAQDAMSKALNAMKLFQWQPTLQVAGLSFLTAMASDYAMAAGKQGSVEAVIAAMRSAADSYQVQLHAVRCLQILIGGEERANLVRARAAGALDVLATASDMHSSDGQLVFRIQQVSALLQSVTEEEAVKEAAKAPASAKSPWGKLKEAVFAGQAKQLSMGLIPGLHGISEQVGIKMQEGVKPLLDFMVERMRSSEAVRWCCDALATMCAGNEEVRAEVMTHKGAERLALAMKRHSWDEDLCAGACMAMTALSADHAKECGAAGAVQRILAVMTTNASSYQVQTRGTQALTALTKGYPPNLKIALDNNALAVVRAALDANPEDGQLQWRGMNLLDALRPGQGEEIRVRALERSFSSFMKRKDSKAQMGGSFVERPPVQPKVSAAAMADVDEMAEAVEEDDEDDED
jgi:hypothetical protein